MLGRGMVDDTATGLGAGQSVVRIFDISLLQNVQFSEYRCNVKVKKVKVTLQLCMTSQRGSRGTAVRFR
jgi:hypothetical protein